MNPFRALLFLILLMSGWAGLRPQQEPPGLDIEAPLPGQALQGQVSVLGSTALDGFQSAELAFAYGQNPTGTWFLIQQMSQPVEDGLLGAWDTTVISDGEYSLRLVVYRSSGEVQETIVSGLRVRNYSVIETNTPLPATPDTPQPTSPASATPTQAPTSIRPSATPLPTNPAVVTGADVSRSLAWGGAAAAGFFVVLGLYAAARWLTQR